MMIERTATIRNAQGIHCRPSAVIMKEVAGYGGGVRIVGKKGESNLRSVLDLLSMELYPGSQVRIRVDGAGEEKMADRLVELFETQFDFPPREEGQA